ncbi:hypothetical protein OG870_17530 [Streptomyces sp. NBC_00461]|uniref:hypothetical protein n=1 Tax=Streptomyces sp. NBC_00461 TaxID=2975750 RepID=UPI002E1937EA
MSPHEKTAIRILAAGYAVILAGQFLRGVYGYFVGLVIVYLLAIRVFGGRR